MPSWKLVRTFDDPATWTEPGVRHLTDTGPGGPAHRTRLLDDQWEVYDLDADPVEARNRWTDPALDALRTHLREVLEAEAARCVPERNQPWPYAARRPPSHPSKTPPRPALAVRRLVQRLACTPTIPRPTPRSTGPADERWSCARTTGSSTWASRPACSPAR